MIRWMPVIQKVNLKGKFSLFQECWSPKIAAEVNDFYVKLVKLSGEFVWHQHEHEMSCSWWWKAI